MKIIIMALALAGCISLIDCAVLANECNMSSNKVPVKVKKACELLLSKETDESKIKQAFETITSFENPETVSEEEVINNKTGKHQKEVTLKFKLLKISVTCLDGKVISVSKIDKGI